MLITGSSGALFYWRDFPATACFLSIFILVEITPAAHTHAVIFAARDVPGVAGKGTPGAADIYEPLLPDEVIFSAPIRK